MNIVKELKFDKLKAIIYHDFRNPRRDYPTLGKILTNNNNYNIHNILTQCSIFNCNAQYTDIQILKKENIKLFFPLYLNNNQLNIQQKLNYKKENLIGWYILFNSQYQEYLKIHNQTNLEKIKNILFYEIQLFNAFRKNNLYTYEILDLNNNILHSSGLIIGLENTIKKCSIYL